VRDAAKQRSTGFEVGPEVLTFIKVYHE